MEEATKPLMVLYWQPIETAPKDGTHFIGVVQGFTPAEAHWDYEKEIWFDDSLEDPGTNGIGTWDLTHWIPMPEYP